MNNNPNLTESSVRETYSEHIEDGVRIGTISDPDNEDAWLRSSLTVAIES